MRAGPATADPQEGSGGGGVPGRQPVCIGTSGPVSWALSPARIPGVGVPTLPAQPGVEDPGIRRLHPARTPGSLLLLTS